MNLYFKKISEEQFYSLNDCVLFQNECSNNFAIFGYNINAKYSIGWRSDNIDPEIRIINHSQFSVGIDQFLAIVGVDYRNIIVRESLDSYYIESMCFDNKTYFFCEDETFVYSHNDSRILSRVSHPDIYISHTIDSEKVIVECMNGLKVIIE